MARFDGLRVLIVEDEGPVAMLVEDMLDDLGCAVVASAASVTEAMNAIAGQELQFALLDVNLAGHKVDPVADELARLGVPFAFASGYGRAGLREDLRGHPIVQKPFRLGDLAAVIRAALPSDDR